MSHATQAASSVSLIGMPKAPHNGSRGIGRMSGREYELYCVHWLRDKGFHNIQTTPATGDYGADIIAYDPNGYKWAFQCKRYSGKVSVKAIQEVSSARDHYRCHYAAVITNSSFTKNAYELAHSNDVRLFEHIC